MRALRWQLVALLVLVAALPSIPAAWTARALLERSLSSRSQQVMLTGAEAGLESTRLELANEKERFIDRILRSAPLDTLSEEPTGWPETTSGAPHPPIRRGPERMRLAGQWRLVAEIIGTEGRPVWVSTALSPGLENRSEELTEAVRIGQGLRAERAVLLRSLWGAFGLVYAATLLVLLAGGILIARRLTLPLESLASGMERVSAGDLTTRVALPADRSLRRLTLQFNAMVGRLRSQQTDLIRLEKTAAWRDMARRLAHEIKNPLTPIQLASQELRGAYRGTDEEYRQLLDESTAIIGEEVRVLGRLVQEFSQFGRLPEPRPRWVPFSTLLDGLRTLHGTERVVWEIAGASADERAPTVYCDPEEIHRVLVNLVKNALEAQAQSERADPVVLRARVESPAGSARIEVQDRGPGVPPDARERIFEPNVSGRPGGMGLGLAIVESIVHAHGGELGVEDRADGGAIFWFTLPAPPPEAEMSPDPETIGRSR
ncbi:MAG: HAMP domain-containing protein [Candidatus Eisenbacteria bacterium]|uniref:histidine kinase n=1 Tax=Eiseniibacteriota bacterium TaxID=2212470 RepID=A0A956M125_UNCEI|nr:HAMP domain-containing protein [Candidatus Eisenbacteria bacterium]